MYTLQQYKVVLKKTLWKVWIRQCQNWNTDAKKLHKAQKIKRWKIRWRQRKLGRNMRRSNQYLVKVPEKEAFEKQRKRSENTFKEMKPENHLELTKGVNHKLSK